MCFVQISSGDFENMPCCGVGELKTVKFWLAVMAELIGTFLFVLIACGSCPEAIHNLLNGFSNQYINIVVPNLFVSKLL